LASGCDVLWGGTTAYC